MSAVLDVLHQPEMKQRDELPDFKWNQDSMLTLDHVNFTYPETTQPALKKIFR